ncbi:PASTA domain-containing protein [Kribbella sp. NPDC058245]|uniref:PASTA domain-containing protein n=1 Tax=Kribbella sp. NPDC058245 TaxID=3346399 RepID=UPI0036EA1CF0
MNEAQLTELLERAGEQTAVNPPPIDAMRAGATRRRRRRTSVFSAAGTALAVAAAMTTTTVLTDKAAPPVDRPPVATPVPEGMRLVGLGHVAIAVPKAWPADVVRCGLPTVDTVIVNPESEMCTLHASPRVESVRIRRLTDEPAPINAEIGGVPVAWTSATCYGDPASVDDYTCGGAVEFPSLGVVIGAISSKNAETAEQMLKQIRIVNDQTGVPAFRVYGYATRTDYTKSLTSLGLQVRYETKRVPHTDKGYVVAVSPAVGTMVPNGSTVTVTVAG